MCLVAHSTGSYVELFGWNIVQSSPGRSPQAVSPGRVNLKTVLLGFNVASYGQRSMKQPNGANVTIEYTFNRRFV
jgi:hypothetical protein